MISLKSESYKNPPTLARAESGCDIGILNQSKSDIACFLPFNLLNALVGHCGGKHCHIARIEFTLHHIKHLCG